MTVSLQELFDNGCHLGHPAKNWHPRMKPWIYCQQEGIHLFDLEKTAAQLEKARARIQELKEAKKSVVVVATKKQAAELVRDLAVASGVMYIVNRWPGGLITNWDQVRRSIRRMNEIEAGLATDKYKNLTKYERMLLEKELARLERLFGGLKDLKSKPDALFVVDAHKEKNAVREAIKEHVEIIAMVDTNTDPTGIDLPIPTNDDAISAIRLVVSEALGVKRDRSVPATKKAVEMDEKPDETPALPPTVEQNTTSEAEATEKDAETATTSAATEAGESNDQVKKD